MNDSEVKKYLNKITGSEVFARSYTNKQLLEYLTEASLKGKKPKEITIAIDVFHHSADDPSTSNIRVHIHKLRKNLALYYSNEGKKDTICFNIPRGGYSIEFKNRENVVVKKRIKNAFFIILVLILTGLIVNIYFLASNHSNYMQLGKTNFWHELIHTNRETVIVVGDYFMFRNVKNMEEHNRVWNIRDIMINSEEELNSYLNSIDSLNSRDYAPLTDVSYMSLDIVYCISNILPVFNENNINYRIITSSDFNWNLFKDFNILYLGSFKNLKSLDLITDKLYIQFDNENFNVLYTDPDKSRTFTPYFSVKKTIDYSLVAKIPRYNNTVLYIFTSSFDVGTVESVKYFSQLKSLEPFEENVLKGDKFFKAIFKSEGFERTVEKFNLVEFKALRDSILKEMN